MNQIDIQSHIIDVPEVIFSLAEVNRIHRREAEKCFSNEPYLVHKAGDTILYQYGNQKADHFIEIHRIFGVDQSYLLSTIAMSTNQTSEEKETFTLERAEEDDEFEEFEKDGRIGLSG